MNHPAIPISFFGHLNEIKEKLSGKKPVLFLDYDGTLTPIVETPDLAVISEEMRQTVKELSSKLKVAIVSGRATDDVRSKVKIDGIFYAGSHGFEINYPDGQVKINEEAAKIRPVIDEVHKVISEKIKDIKGSLVEHVKYTISVHYRLVAEQDASKVEAIVDETLKDYPQLRKGSGKKVYELKPKLDWHKGRAVEWIFRIFCEQEKNAGQLSLWPIYIGDDTTDEDAFCFLKDKGFGILVAKEPRPSEAAYVIADTSAVKNVLEWFVNTN